MSTVDRLRAAGVDIEKLQVRSGDVLVLRTPDEAVDVGWPSADAVDVIGQFLLDHEVGGVLIVVVPAGGALDRLDAEQMAAAGWVRRPE